MIGKFGRHRPPGQVLGVALLAAVLAAAAGQATANRPAAVGPPSTGPVDEPVRPSVLPAGRGLAVPGAVAQPAATAPNVAAMPVYLALGDSIAFGFDPLVAPEADPPRGYPTQVAAALSRTLVDASCPGETSPGFIAASGLDNGCREFRAAHRLHAAYPGTQLEFATDFLRAHPHTDLVTVGIGINDLLRCVRVTDGCTRELAPTLETYRADLNTILRGLRAVYDGELVLVGYYSPDYGSPRLTAAVLRLNAVMAEVARAYRARVADPFTAFATDARATGGDICTAGLLIRLTDSCDLHPSVRGGELLAATVIRAVQAAGPGRSDAGAAPYGVG